jgi:hypothetical protein
MRLLQHVYGRVGRGFESKSAGYQLAAISAQLRSESPLIEALNGLAFYTPRQAGARFSFSPPMPGWLAFGRACLAKDATGAVGSFAHQLVCAEQEFLTSCVQPWTLLQSQRFLGSEADLPENRLLDPIDAPPPGPVDAPEDGSCRGIDAGLADSHEVTPFCLKLLDRVLAGGPRRILVVCSDAALGHVLLPLFALLPRAEAAKLSFSTLFVRAMEHLGKFRLVFVPNEGDIPSEPNLFDVLHAEAGTNRPSEGDVSYRHSLTRLYAQAPEKRDLLRGFIDGVRGHAEPKPAGRDEACLQSLLELGPEFHQCMVELGVPVVREVGRRSDVLVVYGALEAEHERRQAMDLVSAEPGTYLVPILEAAARGRWALERMVLTYLARHPTGERGEDRLAPLAPRPDVQAALVRTACVELDDPSLGKLAFELDHRGMDASAVDRELSRRLLASVARKDKAACMATGRVVDARAGANPARARCAADQAYMSGALGLGAWVLGTGAWRQFDKADLAAADYRSLLEVFMDTVEDPRRLPSWYRLEYESDLVGAVLRRLDRLETMDQVELLWQLALTVGRFEILIIEPVLSGIKRQPKRSRLAKELFALLKRRFPDGVPKTFLPLREI